MKKNLILTWSEKCVLTSKATRDADPDARPAVAAIDNPTNATLKIADAKLYVPVVTLSTENDKKFLEQLRTGIKRTIKWNKYRSEITNQNYLMTDPTFTKVNRLFVLSFENENDRTSFSLCTKFPNRKDFNVLINRNIFFDMPTKNDEETYE